MTRQIVVLQETMLRMAELTHERRERRATAICNVQKEERALPRSSHRLTAVMGEILGVSPVQQALRAHQYVYDTVYETWNTLSKSGRVSPNINWPICLHAPGYGILLVSNYTIWNRSRRRDTITFR